MKIINYFLCNIAKLLYTKLKCYLVKLTSIVKFKDSDILENLEKRTNKL